MQTRFDDADMVRFLRSMPFRARRKIVNYVLGEARMFWMSSVFTLSLAACILAVKFFGVLFAAVLFLITCSLLGFLMVIYRNRILRKFLAKNLVNGILPVCPVCTRDQLDNHREHCECGCLVRPFRNE